MYDQYDRKSNKSQSLKQQRAIARARNIGISESYRSMPATKVFNMRWICDTLDQVLVELNSYASREPEIGSAVEMIEGAKKVITSYGSRVLDTPYKNVSSARPASRGWSRKGQYDNFDANGGFDDASTLFNKQREQQSEDELDAEYEKIEKDTDNKLRSQGVEPCRDDKGHFADC